MPSKAISIDQIKINADGSFKGLDEVRLYNGTDVLHCKEGFNQGILGTSSTGWKMVSVTWNNGVPAVNSANAPVLGDSVSPLTQDDYDYFIDAAYIGHQKTIAEESMTSSDFFLSDMSIRACNFPKILSFPNVHNTYSSKSWFTYVRAPKLKYIAQNFIYASLSSLIMNYSEVQIIGKGLDGNPDLTLLLTGSQWSDHFNNAYNANLGGFRGILSMPNWVGESYILALNSTSNGVIQGFQGLFRYLALSKAGTSSSACMVKGIYLNNASNIRWTQIVNSKGAFLGHGFLGHSAGSGYQTSSDFANSYLKIFYAPKLEKIPEYAFYSCTALESVTLNNVESIPSRAFMYCSKLSFLDLTNRSTIPPLGLYAFNYTPMTNSTYISGWGSIYIPSSLYNTWKTTTNWTNIADRLVSV